MREATRADLPKGTEAQCPRCGRLFGSDSTAERHKRWKAGGRTLTCLDPAELGFVATERRGLAIWRQPMSADALTARQGARRDRRETTADRSTCAATSMPP